MKKIVPGVDYYQVVFTMPEELSSLALGNRKVMFNLLFHTAWKSLKVGRPTADASCRSENDWSQPLTVAH